MEKKGLFTGCSDVISFTAQQNIKGNGFKKSTVIVGFIIAVVFALISILMAVFQDDETSSDIPGADNYEEVVKEDMEALGHISKVLLVENEALDNETMNNLVTIALSLENLLDEKLTVEYVAGDGIKERVAKDENVIAVEMVEVENGRYEFHTYVKQDSKVGEDVADTYMEYVIMMVESLSYQMAGVTADDIIYMEAPYYTMSLSVNDEAEGFAVSLTEMLVPMLFSFLMYAMILMYGQSITKSVVAEKASKLMEYLLTSIKPYALITGKVVALSGMAILQLVIWILCGVAGYFAGAYIAEGINPDYTNYVSLIIDTMSKESDAAAFSVIAVVLALVSLMVGFVMYCVIAAMVAAAVSKIEDMSTTQTLFQLPVIVGWLVAYFAPFTGNDTLIKVANMVPITSPFILPANIVLGRCSIVEGAISLAILIVTIFVLVIFTGKVYKGKLFNRK